MTDNKAEKVRIGIIGLGGMAAGHAKNIKDGNAGDRCEITAAADISQERLDWAKNNIAPDVKCFTDAKELAASGCVDTLLICTPHFSHPELAMMGFDNGLHVLIEKPSGVYTKHVAEMNAAAEKSGKVFAIMFQQRQRGFYQKLKDLVDSGELGKIKRISWTITDWYRSQSYYDSGTWRATWAGEGGGVLLNQCPHQLDIWQWVFGMPKQITAFCEFGKYHDIEVEDDVTAYMKYENGATGTFIASTGEAPGSNRLEIACEMGKLIAENDKLTFYRNRVNERKFNEEFKGGFGMPECWACEVPVEADTAWHEGIIKNFVDAILDGAELIAPGEEGIKSLTLSNAMLLSEWKGNAAIELPFDDDELFAIMEEKFKTSRFHEKKDEKSKPLDTEGTY